MNIQCVIPKWHTPCSSFSCKLAPVSLFYFGITMFQRRTAVKKLTRIVPSASLLCSKSTTIDLEDPVIAMLSAISENGSINQAAKSVGLSYKAAWERIETINNLSPAPVVERKAGGKGGGGTLLTEEGHLFLKRARLFSAHLEKLITLFRETPDEAFEILKTLRGMEMKISARNVWLGNVTLIEEGKINSVVTVSLKGEDTIVSVITNNSVQRLGLEIGTEILVIVKAPSVMLSCEIDSEKISARNILKGRINRIVPGAVNDEVIVDIAGGNTVTSILTSDSVRRLELVENMEVCAIIKASSVLLAVP